MQCRSTRLSTCASGAESDSSSCARRCTHSAAAAAFGPLPTTFPVATAVSFTVGGLCKGRVASYPDAGRDRPEVRPHVKFCCELIAAPVVSPLDLRGHIRDQSADAEAAPVSYRRRGSRGNRRIPSLPAHGRDFRNGWCAISGKIVTQWTAARPKTSMARKLEDLFWRRRRISAHHVASVRGCKTGADHRFPCVSGEFSREM
jgi:hypothetical protein